MKISKWTIVRTILTALVVVNLILKAFGVSVINIDEIHSIKSELYKGDGIISKDTLFHILKLKDGTVIKFTLYAYGKDSEKEILESIKKHI